MRKKYGWMSSDGKTEFAGHISGQADQTFFRDTSSK